MIRKATLQVGVPALLALIAWNAYLSVNHLKMMQKISTQRLESSLIQAQISDVLKDLTDMETGQRGYLLTDNDSYLQPYTEAKNRIATDFARLRQGLTQRDQRERMSESQLESLANAKQAEMERSINLRQQGYRHRAFMLVGSNEGMEYMLKARGLLSSLAAVETSNFAAFDREKDSSLRKAYKETIVSNLVLFLLTTLLFALIRHQEQVLEREAAQSKQDLAARNSHLEKLTFTLCNEARSKTYAIEANARLLLEDYGGFLPRQGHACAEQIQEASAQMEQLRQELVGKPEDEAKTEYGRVA